MQRLSVKRVLCYGLVTLVTVTVLYSWLLPCSTKPRAVMVPKDAVHYVYDEENRAYPYDRLMPLIFIGGVPRSGTTLMRAMLDAHPDVRCGEETRIIPRLLGMRSQWAKSPKETKRLQEAGLSDEVIDSALAAFILEVIAKHGEPAPRLCNKDPFTLKSSIYLSQMFPNSKFLLLIRDGRAVVHSIITRQVTISGFDLKSFRKCLEKWNMAMESMYYQCLRLGAERCMPVHYEQLVLHPKEWMQQILQFLDVPWDDSVLHHEEFINKPKGISLSRTERSTDQVIKPVNLEALTKWVNSVPDDVKRDIDYIAPMLSKLGYDPHAFPPTYGEADAHVASNTLHIRHNEDYWRKKNQEILRMSKPPPKVATPRRTPQEAFEDEAPGAEGGVVVPGDGDARGAAAAEDIDAKDGDVSVNIDGGNGVNVVHNGGVESEAARREDVNQDGEAAQSNNLQPGR